MVKVGETKELEAEIQRLKNDNAELRQKVAESTSLETARKRAEDKLETVQNKVCASLAMLSQLTPVDGRHDSRKGGAKGERAQRDL